MFRRLIRFLPLNAVSGYESAELVDVIFQKTISYLPTRDWPEILGARSVLDFGGGCGVHSKEAARFDPKVRWAVVETPAMVDRAKELEADNLRFFSEIAVARSRLGNIDVMHSNGALQYTPSPRATLDELCLAGEKTMLWYRVFFSPR
jgi:putative methyltransferase (TIGR04325 family)